MEKVMVKMMEKRKRVIREKSNILLYNYVSIETKIENNDLYNCGIAGTAGLNYATSICPSVIVLKNFSGSNQ